jgi:hypothetical protein
MRKISAFAKSDPPLAASRLKFDFFFWLNGTREVRIVFPGASSFYGRCASCLCMIYPADIRLRRTAVPPTSHVCGPRVIYSYIP